MGWDRAQGSIRLGQSRSDIICITKMNNSCVIFLFLLLFSLDSRILFVEFIPRIIPFWPIRNGRANHRVDIFNRSDWFSDVSILSLDLPFDWFASCMGCHWVQLSVTSESRRGRCLHCCALLTGLTIILINGDGYMAKLVLLYKVNQRYRPFIKRKGKIVPT